MCNTALCLSENSLCQRTVQHRTVFAKEMCNSALHLSENSVCQRANCTMQSCVCQRNVQHSTLSVRELLPVRELTVQCRAAVAKEMCNTALYLPEKQAASTAPQHVHQRSGKESHTKTVATVSTVQTPDTGVQPRVGQSPPERTCARRFLLLACYTRPCYSLRIA